jgi:hypothetical protein
LAADTAFKTSGWTPALLSLAKLREGFIGQQFSRLAERDKLSRLLFFA